MGILDPAEAELASRYALLSEWATNFKVRSVLLTEFEELLGRDRIPPIDEPRFARADDAPDYMRDSEPVIVFSVGGDARAYPLAIMMWHEIVNDTVGGQRVSVTFCPLCNSAIVFDRALNRGVVTFGTTGILRNSDLVMWDRQTESWWQQITGEAVVGDLTGTRLRLLPSSLMSWKSFEETYPSGQVLLRPVTAFGSEIRPYDDPPYAGYDDINEPPFLFDGSADPRLPAVARVLTLNSGGEQVAYDYGFLRSEQVVNDRVGAEDIVILFDLDVLSPFEDGNRDPQTTGAPAVFRRRSAGDMLTFSLEDGQIKDSETGSVWTTGGVAVSGPLAGARLEPVVHGSHFWFAWSVFYPDTVLRKSPADTAR
jgi:hypothetical protein